MYRKAALTLALSGLLIIASFLGPTKLNTNASEVSISKNPFANEDSQKELKEKIAKGVKIKSDLFEFGATRAEKKIKEDKVRSEADSQYIVEFKEKVSLDTIYEIVKDYSYTLLSKSGQRVFRVLLSNPDDFKAKTSGLVKNFEKDGKMTSQSISNDTHVGYQWALDALDIPEAWTITTGSDAVFVSVIDSGVDRENPDLLNSDIRVGYDFILDGEVTYDATGHGTMVTGVIAAQTNNFEGIAGVNWNVAVVPLRVVYTDGAIYESDIIEAIYAAADINSDVINLSLGGPDYSTAMDGAIQYANSLGSIVVAAAGNGGGSSYNYPASYNGVISAASVDDQLVRSTFSQYNSMVDVAAPGEEILTTADWYTSGGNDYVFASGTSFSAPYVSGIAALASAINPSLDYVEFFELIKVTSKDLGWEGYDPYYGYGLIDADNLLTGSKNPPSAPEQIYVQSSTYNSNTIYWSRVANASGYEFFRATSYDGVYSRIKTTTLTSFTHTPLVPGSTYFYKVRAYRLDGTERIYGAFSPIISSTNLPAAPWGISVNPSAYNMNLVQWNAVSEASGYELYRSTDYNSGYALIKTTTSTSFVHGPLPIGNTYYYKVRSYIVVGTKRVFSNFSAFVYRQTFGAPPNLITKLNTYNKITVSWGSVSYASGYELYRATSPTGTFALLKSTTGLSFVHGPLVAGTTYYYKVRAYALVGSTKVYSAFSDVTFETSFPAPTIWMSWQTSDTNYLAWIPHTYESGYELYRAINDSPNFALLKSTTSTNYAHGPLVYGTTYRYKIRSYVIVGTTKVYSPFSSEIYRKVE